MLTAFKIKNNCLDVISPSTTPGSIGGAVWIDLVSPTPEEIRNVEASTGISLPNIQETEEL